MDKAFVRTLVESDEEWFMRGIGLQVLDKFVILHRSLIPCLGIGQASFTISVK